MKDIPLTHLLDVAICAAEAAGRHALENKARRTEVTETFDHDVKLVLDVECQEIAEGIVAREFPDHNILGEEGTRQNSPESYEWIIDPIDGTVNFAHGLSYWCCSVAVRHKDKILAGCVFAPEFNNYYTAHIEDVAKLDGQPIHVSDTKHLGDAMILSGLNKNMQTSNEPHFNQFRMLAMDTRKVRINGSAALDLCQVAAGNGDGFFETIYLWDYAAATLIAERAGGVVSIFPNQNEPYSATVLCSNEHLISGLRAIHTKCS